MRPLGKGDPRQIGTFRIVGLLGGGGMGRVYLGRGADGRTAAVKTARAELADDLGFRKRFAREVAAARRVGGPFVAPVVDAAPHDEIPWMATEYVPGISLSDAVHDAGPLPVPTVRALTAGLLQALAAVHAHGLVHRDLKPSNILLTAEGPRVIDFGIAHSATDTALTVTGAALGTPGFMAPEQLTLTGGEITGAADVFALGGVIVYAATGSGPYGNAEPQILMYRTVHERPRLDELPVDMRELAGPCLAREPERRPALADLMARVGTPASYTDWLPAPLTAQLHNLSARLRDPRQPGAAPWPPDGPPDGMRGGEGGADRTPGGADRTPSGTDRTPGGTGGTGGTDRTPAPLAPGAPTPPAASPHPRAATPPHHAQPPGASGPPGPSGPPEEPHSPYPPAPGTPPAPGPPSAPGTPSGSPPGLAATPQGAYGPAPVMPSQETAASARTGGRPIRRRAVAGALSAAGAGALAWLLLPDGGDSGRDPSVGANPAGREPSGGKASPGGSPRAALPAEIREQGRLYIGSDLSYAPMEFLDGDEPVGCDIDLGKAIGRDLNIEVSFRNGAFDTLLPGLASGRHDLILSALTDTTDRQDHGVDLIDYFRIGLVLVVPRAARTRIKGLDDLTGKKIAVQANTEAREHLAGLGMRKPQIREFPTPDEMYADVTKGLSDACLDDYPPAARALADHPGLALTGDQIAPRTCGIAVAKGKTALRDAVRASLDRLIRDGTYGKILKKWDMEAGAVTRTAINGGT
ncbi:protein kinase domain-containing protein [Streptomyces sp. NPDC002067]